MTNNVTVIPQERNGTFYYDVLQNGKVVYESTDQDKANEYAARISTPAATVVPPAITVINIEFKQTRTPGDSGTFTEHYLTLRDGLVVADTTVQANAKDYCNTLAASLPANTVIKLQGQDFERV